MSQNEPKIPITAARDITLLAIIQNGHFPIRADRVIRRRFVPWLLGTKTSLHSFIVRENGIYLIESGTMGAIRDLPLGVVGKISENQYRKQLEDMEESLNTADLDALVKQKKNHVLMPFTAIKTLELDLKKNIERRMEWDKEAGPIIQISAQQGKFTLVFAQYGVDVVRALHTRLLQEIS